MIGTLLVLLCGSKSPPCRTAAYGTRAGLSDSHVRDELPSVRAVGSPATHASEVASATTSRAPLSGVPAGINGVAAISVTRNGWLEDGTGKRMSTDALPLSSSC